MTGEVIGDLVEQSFLVVAAGLAAYTVLINGSYLVLIGAAFLDLGRYRARTDFANYDEWFKDPNAHGVSILMPAHNESASIVTSVTAMCGLHYPDYDVVLVDDGSKDDTAAKVIAEFGLVPVPLLATHALPTKAAVIETWMGHRGGIAITLVRTTGGGKADALNVGINHARKELVCCLDADSLLESTALLQVARPFAENPNVVATGGVVRVANGARIQAGRVTEPRVPAAVLPAVQVVEYLRAFFVGRSGWSKLGGLIIISGAFGVFRTSSVVEVGGYAVDCIGEDAELIVRLHRRLHDERRRVRLKARREQLAPAEVRALAREIVMVPEPVAWTEVPTSLRVLGRQRRRWHRGLADVFLRHRDMVGNPRYGVVGMVTMPWFLLFELLAPAVEASGYVYLLLLLLIGSGDSVADGWLGHDLVPALSLGGLDVRTAAVLMATAVLFSAVVTLCALLAEELTFARYRSNRDLLLVIAGVIFESVGFRQLSLWWRLRGLVDGVRRRPTAWGNMERAGFAAPLVRTASASEALPVPVPTVGPPARLRRHRRRDR